MFMLEIAKFHSTEAEDILGPVQQHVYEAEIRKREQDSSSGKFHWSKQVVRFGLVGSLNTFVDLLILNSLLWLLPTTSIPTLLTYNVLAFSLGAVNSFLLNKYWTFKHKQRTTLKEVIRFMLTTLCGIGWSTLVLWLASTALHPNAVNATLWANASKGIAIVSSALLSFLGMRLWVFVRSPYMSETTTHPTAQANQELRSEQREVPVRGCSSQEHKDTKHTAHSLSVVLPVYNEEDALATTLAEVLDTLKAKVADFEVILVNDGSSDRTGDILAALAATIPQVRVVTHERNQGYGATLADGFAVATKELTFFMDSDGQFDIEDLPRLLTFIDDYDAVIGYRIHRQDTWMRKLNAWGWKTLVRVMLDVSVRDIDCAFKLLRTNFLHQHALQTRGAMINAELLYTLNRLGYTYREVGVHHLPRRGGRATGAKMRVIARAFRELFVYACKQRCKTALHMASAHISK
ncbi:MAG: hypothetical protein NVS4B12_05260 [Ktedonobacteraceae bacterium]